ncbi:Cytochrome P450 [Sergentomyia squamirostris]
MLQIYIALILLAIYLYFRWHSSFFARQGIVGLRGFPIVGNMWKFVSMKKHFGEVYDEIYRSHPTANYVGFFKMGNPAVIVRNLDIVKNILVGDFSTFNANDFIVDPKIDPLVINNVFVATGDRWKLIRNQISPLFTYPRVKACFPIIETVRQSLVQYIQTNKSLEIEVKDLGERFTTDVVASCAFGVEGEAFTNPNSDFKRLASSIFAPSNANMLRSMILLFWPKLTSVLGVAFLTKEVDTWIRSIINQIMKRRETTGETRQDFLQAFIEMKKKDTRNIMDENLIVGQSLTFVTDGIETSSTVICFALYELARNPNIMKQAQNEVDGIYERLGGKMTEEGIMEMEYLERILFETLRMHSAVFALVKIALKDYTFPPQFPDSKKQLTIPKGTSIIIPVNAIHYDPTHFPDPHTFDPSRFTEDAKKERHKYSYLGFGEGPRICLGQKFGVFQVKAALSAILRNYNVRLSSKTIIPPPVSPKSFLLACEEGIWIKFDKRN